VKLLLDENLSPRLVPRIAALRAFAMHVAHLGRSGASDTEVWEYAFQNDAAVVTINAGDFLVLARGAELHTGLIVLRRSGL
jgi:predicted nuclease of predicted toxin-antitoxin system